MYKYTQTACDGVWTETQRAACSGLGTVCVLVVCTCCVFLPTSRCESSADAPKSRGTVHNDADLTPGN